MRLAVGLVLIVLFPSGFLHAQDEVAQGRGQRNLMTRSYIPGMWPAAAYDDAWLAWGVKQRPPSYGESFRERYGLHSAPFDNGPYPMGLRKDSAGRLAIDCLLCHAGSVFGQGVIGLPNSSLDIQTLFEDLAKASGRSGTTPIEMGHTRGTTEAVNFAVFLLSFRNPSLGLRLPPLDLKLRSFLIGDAPAWWLLKKKSTMYHTGIGDARSVRALMQFLLAASVSRDMLAGAEADFRDIQRFILNVTPPRYPFPIDMRVAARGEQLFNTACASCHGTYGAQGAYPNKIIPIEAIGTDRSRYDGLSSEWFEHYNQSWFAREEPRNGNADFRMRRSAGYQAPPLDGIWATAPYFHNGSVPTLYAVLSSGARPVAFTRTFNSGETDFDAENVGWKVRVLAPAGAQTLSPFEQRKIYDTKAKGRGNGGHTYGDRFSDQERRALIEYLKTL